MFGIINIADGAEPGHIIIRDGITHLLQTRHVEQQQPVIDTRYGHAVESDAVDLNGSPKRQVGYNIHLTRVVPIAVRPFYEVIAISRQCLNRNMGAVFIGTRTDEDGVVTFKRDGVLIHHTIEYRGIGSRLGHNNHLRCPTRKDIAVRLRSIFLRFGSRILRHTAVGYVGCLQHRQVVIEEGDCIAVDHAVIDRRINGIARDSREFGCPAREGIRILHIRRTRGNNSRINRRRSVGDRVGQKQRTVVVAELYLIFYAHACVRSEVVGIARHFCYGGEPTREHIAELIRSRTCRRVAAIDRQRTVGLLRRVKHGAVVVEEANGIEHSRTVVNGCIDGIARNGHDGGGPAAEGITVRLVRRTRRRRSVVRGHQTVCQRVALEQGIVVVDKAHLIAIHHAVVLRRITLVGLNNLVGRCPTGKGVRILRRSTTRRRVAGIRG